jgi:hypothetical protein
MEKVTPTFLSWSSFHTARLLRIPNKTASPQSKSSVGAVLAPVAPNLSDSARSGPHPCGNRRWPYKLSKSHLRRSLHQDTLSLRPRLYEPVATPARATCSDDTVSRAKDAFHEFRLGFPVVLIVLNDIEGIDPEALQTETTGDIDSILEHL